MAGRLWPNCDSNFITSNSVGASGGILTLWNKEVFVEEERIINRYFILLKGSFNNFPCIILNLYAPNDSLDRRIIWNEILGLKSRFPIPWCLGGDFNEILEINERLGCIRMERGMHDFHNFINLMEVQDIPMLGRQFTWTNFQDNPIHSRLDKFFLSQEWLSQFNLLQWGLPRSISDHCPILLTNNSVDWGPKPFKFINAWLSHPQCLKIIKDSWESSLHTGWAGFRIMNKLFDLQLKLKEWNESDFGNINTTIASLENQLHLLDILSEQRPLNSDELESRRKAKNDLCHYSKLGESLWRQKSRVYWIKLGDKNTKYFQSMANSRFRRNYIGAIEIDGMLIEDPSSIKNEAARYFQERFREQCHYRPVLDGPFPRRLVQSSSLELESPFTEEEIFGSSSRLLQWKSSWAGWFQLCLCEKSLENH